MNQITAHNREYTRNQADLYLAFELGNKEWKMGFTVGFGQKPRERTVRHINRIKGLLASYGVRMRVDRGFLARLETRRLWDGRPLPLGLKKRLVREYERLEMVKGQIKQVELERADVVKTSESPEVEMVRQLLCLRGIGINSSWLYVMEFFGWRQFRNRREVGALAGLTPTPHQSGEEAWERGISKAGNRHIRAIAIQIAWGWLRWQPESKLSRWYQKRFAEGSGRLRRIGIVALARKLLVDLWRFLETGVIPEGAQLKA